MFNYTASEISNALEMASIDDYKGTISVDSLYEFMQETDSENGRYLMNDYDLKQFLGNLDLKDTLKEQKIRKRPDMIRFFIENVTIDDAGYSENKAAVQQKSEPASVPEEKNAETVSDVQVNLDMIPKDKDYAEMIYSEISQKIIHKDSDSGFFAVSSENVIYQGMAVTRSDKISVDCYAGFNLSHDFCFIVNQNNEVVLFGSFIDSDDGSYILEAPSRNIFFSRFSDNTNYRIVVADEKLESFYSCDISIETGKIEYSPNTLCIDFGTSNTTAGTYNGKDIVTVEFDDVTKDNHEGSYLYPTLVYVKKCGNSVDDIEYLFGYEARKVLIDSNYNPKGSMFFEIKSWIPAYVTYKADIIDETGKKMADVPVKAIIAAYIRRVVSLAEEKLKMKFNKFHFSAPIKLKSKFIEFIKKEVFKEEDGYIVRASQDSLDEGIAIIYNHIALEINNCYGSPVGTKYSDKQIMIIDCGGGTTDIASCSYSLEHKDTGIVLDVATKFENGNSGFGGNNITYRIFQLLKIKLAAYYKNEMNQGNLSISIGNLIKNNENEILESIDSCIQKGTVPEIYDELDKQSCDSENILPVDFNGRGDYARKEPFKGQTRRNFNYLWQLAEKVKIAFFSNSSLVSIDFKRENDKKIVVKNSDTLYFFIRRQSGNGPLLEKKGNVPDIEINTREITSLLLPDIYYQFASLFRKPDGKYIDFKSFDHLKLSGQSCKIPLFHDLLKEFIPGRNLRVKVKKKNDGNSAETSREKSERLKLECIRGCIAYVRDTDQNLVKMKNTPKTPNIIYRVNTRRGGSSHTQCLINGPEIKINSSGEFIMPAIHIDCHIAEEGHYLNVSVTSIDGRKSRENDIDIPLEIKGGKEMTLDDFIKDCLEKKSFLNIRDYYIDSADEKKRVLDKLKEDIEEVELEGGNTQKLLVFALPNSDGYGFRVYQLLKFKVNGGEKYRFIKGYLYNYEDVSSRKSFFKGVTCEPINNSGDDK